MCIIIFDGDNTLWDTNAIFTDAQLAVLEELRNSGLDIDPKEEFNNLRLFDDMLIKKYQKYEYNFKVLSFALYLYYKNKSSKEEAIQIAYDIFKEGKKEDDLDVAEKCYEAFKNKLIQIPSLFPNVKKTLKYLKDIKCFLILLSEGKKERLLKIIDYHDLEQFFDHVSTERKSIEIFNKLISKYSEMLKYSRNCPRKVIVVGDMLEREILIGNIIGAITIYKPGGYKPNQKPKNKMETPNYKIIEISEIIDLIKNF